MSSDDKVLVEQDNPKNLWILAAVIVTCVAIVVMVVAVDQYYRFAQQDEVAAKQLQVESPAKRKVRAMEAAHTTKFQWVDKAKGVVRIPLAQARDLTIRDWAARSAPAPAAEPAEPAPAPKKGGK